MKKNDDKDFINEALSQTPKGLGGLLYLPVMVMVLVTIIIPIKIITAIFNSSSKTKD